MRHDIVVRHRLRGLWRVLRRLQGICLVYRRAVLPDAFCVDFSRAGVREKVRASVEINLRGFGFLDAGHNPTFDLCGRRLLWLGLLVLVGVLLVLCQLRVLLHDLLYALLVGHDGVVSLIGVKWLLIARIGHAVL